MIKDAGLPIQSEKAFVGKNVAERKVINQHFCRRAFIGIGWNQVLIINAILFGAYWVPMVNAAERLYLVANRVRVLSPLATPGDVRADQSVQKHIADGQNALQPEKRR